MPNRNDESQPNGSSCCKARKLPLTEPLVHEDVKDEHETEVTYDGDSPEEVIESASRAVTMAGEHQALGVESTTALIQELSSSHDEENADGEYKGEEDTSDSALSIESSVRSHYEGTPG